MLGVMLRAYVIAALFCAICCCDQSSYLNIPLVSTDFTSPDARFGTDIWSSIFVDFDQVLGTSPSLIHSAAVFLVGGTVPSHYAWPLPRHPGSSSMLRRLLIDARPPFNDSSSLCMFPLPRTPMLIFVCRKRHTATRRESLLRSVRSWLQQRAHHVSLPPRLLSPYQRLRRGPCEIPLACANVRLVRKQHCSLPAVIQSFYAAVC